MGSPAPGLRCRQIDKADVGAVASLLARGFPARDRHFWLEALAQLTRHGPPPGLPQYGYLLESGGVIVGAIILICSALPDDGGAIRCNLSSWYVDPAFRAYAPMLVAQALRRKDVTYLNVSPAPHTRPIIEAQGFSRYCDGIFVAMPMLNRLFGGSKVEVFDADRLPETRFDENDAQMLRAHAAYGCISLWCVAERRASPLVFRARLARRFIPCAQLIYCRDIGDLVRYAGPVGRALARRDLPLMIIDANAPIPGLWGLYRSGRLAKYFKGPRRPRLGDLACSESALMGV
jgi:hypothetical protein